MEFDPKIGHKLYTLLLQDVLRPVPKDGHLIIVPDEVLGLLPFGALVRTMPRTMEFYYDEIDNDVLIITADGGLNADTSEQLIQSIEKLVDAGLKKRELSR